MYFPWDKECCHHLLHVPTDHCQSKRLEGPRVVLVRQAGILFMFLWNSCFMPQRSGTVYFNLWSARPENISCVGGLHPLHQLLLTHVLQVVQPVPAKPMPIWGSDLCKTISKYSKIFYILANSVPMQCQSPVCSFEKFNKLKFGDILEVSHLRHIYDATYREVPIIQNHCAQKSLAEGRNPAPPPLAEKNPLSSFWRPPYRH